MLVALLALAQPGPGRTRHSNGCSLAGRSGIRVLAFILRASEGHGGLAFGIPAGTPNYRQGVANFGKRYAPLVDQWVVYDGSDRPAVKIISNENETEIIFDDDRFAEINKLTPELLR
jgi:hypothetical protein